MEFIPLRPTPNGRTHAGGLIFLSLCFCGATDVHNYLGTALLKLFSVFLVPPSVYPLHVHFISGNSLK